MKNIQSLTLMMAVMVYAAPITDREKELLGEIEEKAAILKNDTMALDVWVPKLTPDSHSTCVDEFFCLAEKALKKNTTESQLANVDVKTLIRLLHQYNKIQTNITCSLNTAGQFPLQEFLEDIMICCELRKTELET